LRPTSKRWVLVLPHATLSTSEESRRYGLFLSLSSSDAIVIHVSVSRNPVSFPPDLSDSVDGSGASPSLCALLTLNLGLFPWLRQSTCFLSRKSFFCPFFQGCIPQGICKNAFFSEWTTKPLSLPPFFRQQWFFFSLFHSFLNLKMPRVP